MKLKRIFSVLLAASITLAMPMAVSAADATGGSVTSPGEYSTTFTGTIKATQLSVTVPTAVAFDMDPTKEVSDSDINAQITNQSSKTQIQNKSAVPIWVSVKSVTTSATTGTAPTLTGTKADAYGESAKDRNIMFAVKGGSEQPSLATSTDWLTTTNTANYKLTSASGKVDSKQATPTEGKDILSLTVYGIGQNGWSVGDSFTVIPVFTVSTSAPTI